MRNVIYRNIKDIDIRYKSAFRKIILFVLCMIPDDFFFLGTLYKSTTPSYIDYKWLDYRFGVILACMMLFGLFYSIIHRKRLLLAVFCIQLVRELFFYFLNANNLFSAGAYEIYLTIFLGAFVFYVFVDCLEVDGSDGFFIFICFANIMTVFLNLLLDMNGIAGRYNAINLSVESTGSLCSLFILYLLGRDIRHKYLYVCISFVALYLSGSRICLLLLVGVVGLRILYEILSEPLRKSVIVFLILALLFFLAVGVYLFSFSGSTGGSDNRMIATFSLDNIISDDSFLGRMQSIGIGFKILKNHPFGISGYFINLQENTRIYGFPTFPHCMMLVYYLLLGPITLYFVYKLISLAISCSRTGSEDLWVVVYVFLFFVFTGAPVVNFKEVVFYLTFLYLCNKSSICKN